VAVRDVDLTATALMDQASLDAVLGLARRNKNILKHKHRLHLFFCFYVFFNRISLSVMTSFDLFLAFTRAFVLIELRRFCCCGG